jgi:hypothetical protein
LQCGTGVSAVDSSWRVGYTVDDHEEQTLWLDFPEEEVDIGEDGSEDLFFG